MSREYWQAHIQGHQFDIDELKALLAPDGYLIEQGDDKHWYIGGHALDDCDTAQQVRDVVSNTVKNANAAILLSRSNYKPITVGSTILQGDTVNVALQVDTVELRMKVNAVVIDAAGETKPQPAPYERERKWLQASSQDSEISAVLNLFTSGKDHASFRAFERVRKCKC